MNSVDSIGNTSSKMFHAIHFRLLQLLITIGLILCIVGGSSSTSSAGVYQPQATTKAGVVLYVIALIILAVIAAVAAKKLSNTASDDRRIVWAVIIALPLILIRIVYSLISVFSHNRHFNLITGSVVIHVFMSVLEEMAVVIIYLVVGWKTEALLPSDRGPIASRPWKGNLESRGATQGGNGRRRRQGPIHTLVGAGIAAAQRRKEGNSETGEP